MILTLEKYTRLHFTPAFPPFAPSCLDYGRKRKFVPQLLIWIEAKEPLLTSEG